MNILIDIAHPAHVHLLKNVFKGLKEHGHNVTVTTKDIPAAMQLMDQMGIPYIQLGKKKDSLWQKGLDQLMYNLKVMRIVRKNQITIGVGSSLTLAHVSKLTKMSSIILDDDDDEVEPLFVKYGHPFADVILSPACAHRQSKKTIPHASYHELAYLHPQEFVPDPSVLKEAGVSEGDRYFILRFNAFKAHHDVGVVGLTIENKRRLVNYLKTQGKVFITTERDIDDEFKPYQLKVSPEKAHSLLYYATMLIGDSQTMTSEAAVLGTPAIRCNTFVGRIHYLEEEEHKYGLTYGFRPEQSDEMFKKIEDILAMPNLREEWAHRHERMLSDKIDYAKFLTWFIENYPASAEECRQGNIDWNRWK